MSIPSNIVEGKARGSNKDYARFLMMSRGSLEEVKYQLLLAKDLKYIDGNKYKEFENRTTEIGKMLNALIKKVKATT